MEEVVKLHPSDAKRETYENKRVKDPVRLYINVKNILIPCENIINRAPTHVQD